MSEMTKMQAQAFIRKTFRTLPAFCDKMIAAYDRVRTGRANEREKQKMLDLINEREKITEALAIVYRDMPDNAPPASFPLVAEFIKLVSAPPTPLYTKPNAAICLGSPAKSLLELSRFRYINSEAQAYRKTWQKRINQLNLILEELKKRSY